MSMLFNTSAYCFKRGRRHASVCVVSLCVCLLLPDLAAQDLGGSGMTAEEERELAYADALLAAQLPNYASMVLDKLNLPPEIMAIRNIRSLTARGDFDAARVIVNANTGTDQAAMTLRLALADGYFAHGRYTEAGELYDSFFKAFPQGPEEALKPFYMSSAYKYAQMMIMTGNRPAAANAYRMALRAKPDRHIERQLQSELAELLMLLARDASGAERKKLTDEVQKLAENILWVQDLWFGRAIVLLAHMRVLEGDVEGAMQLVEDYTPQLRQIDEVLREQSEELGEDLTRLSPMAQCRYMIGEIMHDRAMQIVEEGGDRDVAMGLLIGRQTARGQQGSGAVQHFANVFIRYPNTSWAPHAGNRLRQVEELLEREFGRKVNIQISQAQRDEVERAQFREARTLFNQARFADAANAYLDVLALFPERPTSLSALGELAISFIELEDYDFADVVVRHLGERFSGNEAFTVEAGNQIVRIAAKYTAENQHARHIDAYEQFFTHFKKHPRVLLDLQRFAREALAAEDTERAERYLLEIVANHAGRPAYYEAMSSLARMFQLREDQQSKARILMRLVQELEAAGVQNHLRISANYRLAYLMRELGPRGVEQAQVRFRALRQLLEGAEAEAYAANAQEIEANQRFLQASIFYAAVTDAMRTTVPDNIRERLEKQAGRKLTDAQILDGFYKVGAIRQFNQMVERYPQSPFAPAALSQIGTLNTILQRTEDAATALERLQRLYPESPEAANAVYIIGVNLLKMDRREEAIAYFKQMFTGAATYPVGQIYGAGQELLEAGEHEIALEAFDRVLAMTQERRLVEPTRVGKGRALIGLQRFRAAAEWMDKVVEDYPQSGLTILTCRTASEAYAGLASTEADQQERSNLFGKSVQLMNRARQFAQDEVPRTELDIAVAGLSERRAEAERQFGTPARVRDYMNEAVAAYQAVMMFRDASNAALAPHIQTAYGRAVPIMVELGRWEDVFQDAQTYLEKFPNGRFANAMRQAMTTARIQGDISE